VGPQIKASLKNWTDWIDFLTKLTHPWWYLKTSDGKPPVIASSPPPRSATRTESPPTCSRPSPP
jgi:hypothetical protein